MARILIRRGAFTAIASAILGCACWLILNSFLGPGSITLISFSILISAVVLTTVLLLGVERKKPLLTAAGATSVLLIQEILLNGEQPTLGLLMALSGTVGFPMVGALATKDEQLGYAMQVAGLVFACRVAYVPFPQKFLNLSIGLPAIYLVISVMCILFILVKKIDLRDLGFQQGKASLPSQILAGISMGILSGAVEYLLLKPPAIQPTSNPIQSAIYIIFLMVVLVGLSEELLFRGLVQKSISNVLPPWAAIQVASIQFGLMHLGWRSPMEVLFAYGMGVIMGYMFWKTESLVTPVLMHGLGNVVMFSLASLTFDPTTLTLQLAAGSTALTIGSLHLLRRTMPVDYSASIKIHMSSE